MIKNNNIAIFPYPDWSNLTDSDLALLKKPYCISWYEISEDGDIHYGFKTEDAKKFLKEMFFEVMFVDEMDYKTQSPVGLERGVLFFYDNKSTYSTLKDTTKKYFLSKKKESIFLRKGITNFVKATKPKFISSQKKNSLSTSLINEHLTDELPIISATYFTPEAGETIILFDENLKVKAKGVCLSMGIKIHNFNSIDQLPNPG
ncbi:hypothetical protein [Pantoea rwandensis]|uniref:Uncharacterized protein n=1 Tax=Pantoea rwandensis TaxID=1076550 RepID=A0A1X1CVJ7_9GAMM|nr:hypothetical protein [Pantoea rwandensis]ORM68438.1 hypothetical protein HA51_14860 [Pantoea rwandensis]